MAMTITISDLSPTMEDPFTVTVTDDSDPTYVTVLFVITAGSGVVNKTFHLPLTDAPTHTYSRTLHGWNLGVFASQTITVIAFSDTPDSLTTTPTMTVIETKDPIEPLLDYFINFLQNDPELSTYANTFKKLRKPKQYMTETNGFYVRLDEIEQMGIIGSAVIDYHGTITVSFMEDIRGKREQDDNKHATFIKLVSEHVEANPQLDTSLGKIVAKPRRANIPWNTFQYVNTIESVVEIEFQIIPDYN